MWEPPTSGGILIQEEYWPDEWKILTCCLLLNLTSIKQVRPMIHNFFEKYPTPSSIINAEVEELQQLLKPLGFWRKRTKTLKRFSEEFVGSDWKMPKDLFGCGKYANDCWKILCAGQWRETSPGDHALNEYQDFLNDYFGDKNA